MNAADQRCETCGWVIDPFTCPTCRRIGEKEHCTHHVHTPRTAIVEPVVNWLAMCGRCPHNRGSSCHRGVGGDGWTCPVGAHDFVEPVVKCETCGKQIEPWVDDGRKGWSHVGSDSFRLNGLHKAAPYVAPRGCTCPHEFKSPGRLYGIMMMDRWLRMSAAPDCPEHAKELSRHD